MTASLAADVVIVGSGISGLLVAAQCAEAGREVLVIERGGLVSHPEQLARRRHEADVPGARHNHETAPGTPAYPWDYVYGVGGSSLHWTGHAPRLRATDLRMRSLYGVMEDWPIDFAELEPYLERAETALAVAGAPVAEHVSSGGQPPHAFSPLDETVADLLDPYLPLPQARPSLPVGRRPACCGEATCELCPVDSRFSALNGLDHVLASRRVRLQTETVAVRFALDRPGRRATALEAVLPSGSTVRIEGRAFVLAASGFENPAILLRSGLDRSATGRFLFDHRHRSVLVRVDRELDPGRGASIVTGYTAAFLEGPFRSRHSAAIALLFNPGLPLGEPVAEALLRGLRGKQLRAEAAEQWRKTLVFDVLLEDEPRPDRRVTLSPRRDRRGVQLVRVAYAPSGRYELDGLHAAVEGLTQRLGPLGVRRVECRAGPAGGHLLGTCRMGSGPQAVVDPDLRHLDVDNLWVVGGSAFPTYSPSHPTLTIGALAIRAGVCVVSAT